MMHSLHSAFYIEKKCFTFPSNTFGAPTRGSVRRPQKLKVKTQNPEHNRKDRNGVVGANSAFTFTYTIMSGNKLHPIYVALDSHQYNRAVKLASALPESNTLGKALLAHAYSKSGQRYPALVTLNKILGNFCELKHELENSIEAISEEQQLSKPQAQQHPQNAASKKGKKGKKKPSPATNQKSVPPKEDNESKIMTKVMGLQKSYTHELTVATSLGLSKTGYSLHIYHDLVSC